MKTVKVPVALIVLLTIVIVAMLAYMYDKAMKVSEDVVTNEKMKLENERLGWLAQIKATMSTEEVEFREPIGFKLA